jgi:hypothetical protein
MSDWSKIAVIPTADLLVTFGESVTYIKMGALPISIRAIPDRSNVTESAAPGYFLDLQVDPAVVSDPRKGDKITWTDGVIYVVGKVARPDLYGMYYLALHRQTDPAF